MCSSCGLSNYSGAMLHLFTHAFFKGLLFPAAGAAIHSIGNGQNVPKVGGLNRVLIMPPGVQHFQQKEKRGPTHQPPSADPMAKVRPKACLFLLHLCILFHLEILL